MCKFVTIKKVIENNDTYDIEFEEFNKDNTVKGESKQKTGIRTALPKAWFKKKEKGAPSQLVKLQKGMQIEVWAFKNNTEETILAIDSVNGPKYWPEIKNPKTLILGSFPGKKSLEEKRYYANNGNKFWDFLLEAFNENHIEGNDKYELLLTSKSIALWDVFKSGVRFKTNEEKITISSSDHDFKFLRSRSDFDDFNNFSFCNSHTQIITNGRIAEKYFKQMKLSFDNVIHCLSTSSGNYCNEEKKKALKEQWVKALQKE